MGSNPPSFYAAFGSKKEAFIESVELYIKTIGFTPVDALNSAKSLRAGLKAMLECSMDIATSNQSGGCMLVLGVVNNLPSNQEVWNYLKGIGENTFKLIYARIEQAVAEGELPSNTDIKVLASCFLGLTQSISFQARDGVSQDFLLRLVETAMALLP